MVFNDLYIEILNGEVPQKTREFIFSPQVGTTIQGSRSSDPVSEDETERVRHDGRGILEMTNLKLSKLNTSRPFIDEMDFDVKITYRPRLIIFLAPRQKSRNGRPLTSRLK